MSKYKTVSFILTSKQSCTEFLGYRRHRDIGADGQEVYGSPEENVHTQTHRQTYTHTFTHIHTHLVSVLDQQVARLLTVFRQLHNVVKDWAVSVKGPDPRQRH